LTCSAGKWDDLVRPTFWFAYRDEPLRKVDVLPLKTEYLHFAHTCAERESHHVQPPVYQGIHPVRGEGSHLLMRQVLGLRVVDTRHRDLEGETLAELLLHPEVG